MKMQSICPDIVLRIPGEDYKTAVRVEQYRVSRQAIYFAAFPGTRYLPFRAVRQAWAQKAGLPLTGCCGKELQIVALRMKYKGDFYHTFTFEKQKAAEQVLGAAGRTAVRMWCWSRSGRREKSARPRMDKVYCALPAGSGRKRVFDGVRGMAAALLRSG